MIPNLLKFAYSFAALAPVFLLMPYLAALNLDSIARKSKLPETRMIPATHAVRSALALKLVGTERKSQVYDLMQIFTKLNESSFIKIHWQRNVLSR